MNGISQDVKHSAKRMIELFMTHQSKESHQFDKPGIGERSLYGNFNNATSLTSITLE